LVGRREIALDRGQYEPAVGSRDALPPDRGAQSVGGPAALAVSTVEDPTVALRALRHLLPRCSERPEVALSFFRRQPVPIVGHPHDVDPAERVPLKLRGHRRRVGVDGVPDQLGERPDRVRGEPGEVRTVDLDADDRHRRLEGNHVGRPLRISLITVCVRSAP